MTRFSSRSTLFYFMALLLIYIKITRFLKIPKIIKAVYQLVTIKSWSRFFTAKNCFT